MIVHRMINDHFQHRENRNAHYEDLYAALQQLEWDCSGELTMPLISTRLAEIERAAAHLLRTTDGPYFNRSPLASLANRAQCLIEAAVFYGLKRAISPVGLEVISDVVNTVDETDIFTLNHDTLVEGQLENSRISYADGFGEQNGPEALQFNWSWNGPGVRTRLYKLHGGIDWYFYRSADGFDQFFRVKGDPDNQHDKSGRKLDLLRPMPAIIAGTMFKEMNYGRGLTGEQFHQFRERLKSHRYLICCGYGWGDQGINVRVVQWLRDARQNRLVILHGDPNDDLRTRSVWANRWQKFRQTGKIIVIPKWLSDCRLFELTPFFS